jgi:chitodextrinase/lysophospholipase L1-like esterase
VHHITKNKYTPVVLILLIGFSLFNIPYIPKVFAAAPPTFIQEAETVWDTNTTKTTAAFNVQTGDILVAYAVAEDSNGTTSLAISGGSLTWTNRQTVNVSQFTYVGLWTATVDTNKSMSVTFSSSNVPGGGLFGGDVLTFRGSDGVGASVKSNSSGTASVNLTTTQTNSAIVVANSDWNAATGSRIWMNNAGTISEQSYNFISGRYAVYGGYHADSGAVGTYNVGLSAPTGQKYSIVALEIKGSAGGTPPPPPPPGPTPPPPPPPPPPSGNPLTIDGSQKFQTMNGMGVNINSLSWMNGQSKAAIDLLADQMGSTIWRVVFDMEDWESTNDDSDPNTFNWTYYNNLYSNSKFQNLWGTLGYLNQKGQTNGIILSFMGRAPSWMGTATTISSANESEWVETMASLIYYARNTALVQFNMLDPINEPDWDGIEGPQVNSAQYVRLISKLSTKLDSLGLSDIQFVGPNTASVGSCVNDYMTAMLANTTIMSKLAHFGCHTYSGDAGGADNKVKSSAYPTKNFWMTETADPAQVFDLIGQNAASVQVWEGFDSVYNHAILAGRGSTAPNDNVGFVPLSYNSTSGTYATRNFFYKDAAMFKYVTAGAQRISSTESVGAVETYSFYNSTTSRFTLVGENTGAATNFTGTLSNLPTLSNLEFYRADNSSLTRLTDVAVSSNSFSFAAPANTYFVLTGIAGGALPDTTAPSIPANLATNAVSTSQINLTWSASTDNVAVTGYRIFRNGSQINTSTGNSYSDTGLAASTTYNYSVSAYDAANNVSSQSTQVSGTTNSASGGAIAAMPIISRGKPAFASTNNASANLANDSDYTTTWSGSQPGWIAYDLSSVPSSQRQQVAVAWHTGTGNRYDNAIFPEPKFSIPGPYVIESNAAPSASSAPTTGWVILYTSPDPQNYSQNQHSVNLAGANWIRFRSTAVNINNSSGSTGISFNLDVHDAHLGVQDSWIFYGDSITQFAWDSGSYGSLINAAKPQYFPAATNAGFTFAHAYDATPAMSRWLALFPGKYVGLAFGTNDAGGSTPVNFYNDMKNLADQVLAAGKVPIIPTIPWDTNSTHASQINALNAQITQLISDYTGRIVSGPDLWTAFLNKPNLFQSGGLHPNAAGNVVYRQEWANKMQTVVYNGASSGQPISGDINSDHIVNSIDYSILNAHWFQSYAPADLNSDGICNAIDYSILNTNWFKTW